jgi:hypothetical protein
MRGAGRLRRRGRTTLNERAADERGAGHGIAVTTMKLPFGAIAGASAQATLPASPWRRYALREISHGSKHRSEKPS